MEFAAAILTAWSAAIFAVIEAVGRVPGVREHPAWVRALPLMPLIIGGATGPWVVPLLAAHVPWLTGVGPGAAVLIGVGAGAMAASGHSARRQTVEGRDERLRARGQGEGRGGEPGIRE